MSRALVVRGGWAGHEPVQASDRFVAFLREKGFEVVVSDTLQSYTDEALMGSLALVVPCWTMGEISREQSAGLLQAVRGELGYGKRRLPVLVLTGDDNRVNQMALLREGANDLVLKPIEERLLVTKALFQLRLSRM